MIVKTIKQVKGDTRKRGMTACDSVRWNRPHCCQNNFALQRLSSECQNRWPASALPQRAQRSAATSTTDENISQVSKYSPQTALSLTTHWFPLQDAVGKLFTGKPFREKDGGRVWERGFKQNETEERRRT